jgi:hypothetical protein
LLPALTPGPVPIFGHVLMLLMTALHAASLLFVVRAGPSGTPLVLPRLRPWPPTRLHLSNGPGPPHRRSFVTSAMAHHPPALTPTTITRNTTMMPFLKHWPSVTPVTTRHALAVMTSRPLTLLLWNNSMKDLKSFMIAHFAHAVLATAHAKRVSLGTALNHVHLTTPVTMPLVITVSVAYPE